MTDIQVAGTILSQLGRGALYLLGARAKVAIPDGVQFSIAGSKKCNLLRIILEPEDTYKIQFYKVTSKPLGVKQTAEVKGVYVDQLNTVIENNTGLYTYL